MKEIRNFIDTFLKTEIEASDASIKPDLEDYNKKLDFMNSFCVEELHNKFGMIPHNELKSEEFYERWKEVDSANKRNVYKLSHYKNDKYEDIYVVYLSLSNPINGIFRYGDCLFITRIDGNLKIVKQYLFSNDVGKKRKFKYPVGLEDISFDILKKPIHVERYLEPVNDKEAMEHYSKDI
ncbi:MULTISPECIES: hypothetical protein [unclassified Chryseobacterium]|uniref:hypothetical protein n=1 Tax=unclassified Chryseobacterium TaxID=2593645 RepID=UPI0030172715